MYAILLPVLCANCTDGVIEPVKTQKCMHTYYPDMYLILYCMTCFIVLYLIYVIYYACRFEKLLRAYVDCYKMYRL